jgi:anti-sigma B factor antagonist
MQLSTTKNSKYYIISLSGELDAGSALSLDEAIANALKIGEKFIIVNCLNLNYVSSAGLGVFISYLSEFEKLGIYFALSNVKANVFTTLQILGLEKLINIIDKDIDA